MYKTAATASVRRAGKAMMNVVRSQATDKVRLAAGTRSLLKCPLHAHLLPLGFRTEAPITSGLRSTSWRRATPTRPGCGLPDRLPYISVNYRRWNEIWLRVIDGFCFGAAGSTFDACCAVPVHGEHEAEEACTQRSCIKGVPGHLHDLLAGSSSGVLMVLVGNREPLQGHALHRKKQAAPRRQPSLL